MVPSHVRPASGDTGSRLCGAWSVKCGPFDCRLAPERGAVEGFNRQRRYYSLDRRRSIYHKCVYMQGIIDELVALKKCWGFPDSTESPRFIFVSHSIGVHFTQRMFMLRPHILKQSKTNTSLD
jgi:hypothetical protein